MSARAAPIPKPAPPQRGPALAPQAATPDASGKHRPQDRAAPSADGHGLLGSAGQPISRKPTDAGYGDLVAAAATSSAPAPGKPAALPKQGSVPRPTSVIELQGAAELAPGAWGDYIKSFRGDAVEVDVKWGTLAPKTSIQLQWDPDLGFVTPRGSYQPLAIVQPFFHGLPALLTPALFVHIRGGVIDGFAAPQALKHVTAGHKTALANALAQAKHLAALGLVGFKLPSPVLTNEIQHGHFVFGSDALPFTIASWVRGSLALHLTDDKVSFAAAADATMVGLGAFHLEVTRKDGHYEGQVNIPLKLGKASGNVLARYVNGDVSVTGTISYASEKFNGSLTVMSGDANEVRDTARGLLDPGKLLADEKVADDQTAEKPKKGQRGIGAWGQLMFTFTDWLTGTAVTILDPFGHLTIVGKIAVAKEVVLMKAPPPVKKSIPPFPLGVTARYGLPHIADVHIGFDLDLGYTAWVGPAVLTNIELGGTYSTDPKILQDFYIGGSFRISAYAGLDLSVSVKAGVTVLGHDLNVDGTITASAGLKAYAAADPKIGYREKADPIAGKKGEAYLQGHLEAAAQPVLGLGGKVAIKLSTPWWSPLSDREWPLKLVNYEWPLDSSLGVGADIDYIIGSDKLPDVKFGKVDFDASKFSDAVIDDKVPPKKGSAETEKPGTWKGVAPKTPIAPRAPAPKGPPAAGGKPARAGAPSTKIGRGGQTPAEAKNEPKTPDAGKRRLAGLHALAELHDRAEKRPESAAEVHKSLDSIRTRFGFKSLTATQQGDYVLVDPAMGPRAKQRVKTAPAAHRGATQDPAMGQEKQNAALRPELPKPVDAKRGKGNDNGNITPQKAVKQIKASEKHRDEHGSNPVKSPKHHDGTSQKRHDDHYGTSPKHHEEVGPYGKPKHPSDQHKKDPGRNDEQDRVTLQRVARDAARRAWAAARSLSSREVLRRSQIESSVDKSGGGASGFSPHTELVLHGSTWSMRVTAHKGSQQSSSTEGNGVVLKSKRDGEVFFVAHDLTALERRVADGIRAKLQKSNGDRSTNADPRSRVADARRVGQQQLDSSIRGLQLSLNAETGSPDSKLEVKGLIDPNYWEWKLQIDSGEKDLQYIRDQITARSQTGRLNELLGFLKHLGEKSKIRCDISHHQLPYDRALGRKPEEYVIVYSSHGKTLTIRMGQLTENGAHCALSDRSLGAGKAWPHDAISAAQWKDAFEMAAATMRILTSNPAYGDMLGYSSPRRGQSHAVADGQSSQPFDGNVHGSKSAVQRHDDTAGMALTDQWTLQPPPVGAVTVEEYQGKDWSRMLREEKVAAMRVRARLVIADIGAAMARPGGLQNKIMATLEINGGFETMARAHAFLVKLYYHVLKLAS